MDDVMSKSTDLTAQNNLTGSMTIDRCELFSEETTAHNGGDEL